MACRVQIDAAFHLPEGIRKRLRERLERICAVLDALDRAFLESLAESSLALKLEAWQFRYEYDLDDHRLVVTEAVPE